MNSSSEPGWEQTARRMLAQPNELPQLLSFFLINVLSHKNNLVWLSNLLPKKPTIVHFGCNLGSQTFTLAWFLVARNCIGIDINKRTIEQAKESVVNFEDDLKNLLRSPSISPELRDLANQLRLLPIPSFDVADVRASDLASDVYDLVFCDYVLNHIGCQKSKKGLESAVSEMARVAKANALVVAVEPERCGPEGEQIDYQHYFSRLPLTTIDGAPLPDPVKGIRTFAYRKS